MTPDHHVQAFASRLTVSQYEQEVHDLQRRMQSLLAFKYSLQNMAIWTLVWGTVALVLRMLWGTPVSHLLWGAVGWLPALFLASWLASREVPQATIFRAWIDQQAHCGGLFMAADEVDMGQWKGQLPASTLPTLAWKSSRSWAIMGASLLFLAASFLVPEQQFRQPTTHQLAIGEQVGQLKKQIKTLKQERVITKQRAQDLEKKLAALQKQAKGTDPAKTFQALDHVSQKLKNLARQATEKSLAQAEKWNRAEKVASQLSKMAQQMKPSELSNEMKKLAKMLQSAMKADPQLRKMMQKGMSREMRKALNKMALKRSHLKKISRMCKGGSAAMGKRLSKLSQAGLTKGKALASFKKMKKGGIPGSGGINRGPGEAPMLFQTPNKSMRAKFKPNVLPPATVLNLLASQRVGMSVGRPTQKGKAGNSSTGGVLGKVTGGKSGAHTQQIYPQHLGTIRRYFQRSQK